MADLTPIDGTPLEIDETLEVEDDLYPADGVWFQPEEPAEQKRDTQAEKAKNSAAKPLLKDLIIRLQNRIAYYDSVQSIDKSDMKDPKKFLIAVRANQQTANNFREELAYYVSLLDDQK